MQEQPGITGAAERLVAVMDAAVGDHDGLVIQVLEADSRPHHPQGNDRLHPETTSQARFGDEGDLGDREVLGLAQPAQPASAPRGGGGRRTRTKAPSAASEPRFNA